VLDARLGVGELARRAGSRRLYVSVRALPPDVISRQVSLNQFAMTSPT
jgi:hypothetical protein